jgi:hypothetical protein
MTRLISSHLESNPHFFIHITVQGIGMQQHSKPSHSKHFVFPAAPASGFTIELMVEEAAEPGPLWFMGALGVAVHMVGD